MRHHILAAAAATTLTLLIGCGESGPTLVPISGTVTNNGKPVEGATIVFTPTPGNALGQPATDVTGPEGNYKAMTRNRAGVVPGPYQVSITKTPTVAKPENDAFQDDPYMAQLTATPVGVPGRKKPPAGETLEETFDREVTDSERVMDFDLKGKSKADAK